MRPFVLAARFLSIPVGSSRLGVVMVVAGKVHKRRGPPALGR
jgi:hypothetical protein